MLGNEYKQFLVIVDGMAIVSDVICIYANIEALFVQEESALAFERIPRRRKPEKTATDCLNDAIASVYTDVLGFLSEAKQFFGKPDENLENAEDKTESESGKLKKGVFSSSYFCACLDQYNPIIYSKGKRSTKLTFISCQVRRKIRRRA